MRLFKDDIEEDAGAEGGRFAQVAPEQGLEKPEGLTYRVPDNLADLRVGDRVEVPLGRSNRKVSGYVLSITDTCDLKASKLKAIHERVGRSVNLPEELIELARWIGRYYCCPLGMVFSTLLPAAVKKGTGVKRRTRVRLAETGKGEDFEAVAKEHKLRGKQVEVLRVARELFEEDPRPIDLKGLADMGGAKSVSPVKGLVDKGLLEEVKEEEVKAAWNGAMGGFKEKAPGVELNAGQQAAVDSIVESGREGFVVNVLHGVTGSGKTEVYIRILEEAVSRGKGAIVLVPEIALTPQTVSRFTARFDGVAVLHSGLTGAQRHEEWDRIRRGEARLVVGARSAVFAPVLDLGVVIVDEEHDTSYKQDQLPRYHARDVAIKRAQLIGAAVVLGSATPSLESYHNATEKRGVYRLIEMPNRVLDMPLPKVELVDMIEERRRRLKHGDRGQHLLSIPLEEALGRTFEAGDQAMLLLNRRGYANYIACPDHRCGWVMTCRHCDAHMVYHKGDALPRGGLLRCHYCGFENLLPRTCPTCQRQVNLFGMGTQRVEEEIERKFHDLTMARMDSDTMRGARDYERQLELFRKGKTQLLMGTQMIAKGLDFPKVRLVGVVSADTALNLPDFRASERTFQLVCQVAGRSGRSAGGGRVIVQTFVPEHMAITHAAAHDYAGFAREELGFRKAVGLPPISRMARVVLRDKDLSKAEVGAAELACVLRSANERLGAGAELLGPMPAPIARIGDYHRQQIEITAPTASAIQRLVGAVRESGMLKSDAHTAIDVDPVSLL
ncbi:MAG: replication restart helicase PriA [Planctomycetota bacterium]